MKFKKIIQIGASTLVILIIIIIVFGTVDLKKRELVESLCNSNLIGKERIEVEYLAEDNGLKYRFSKEGNRLGVYSGIDALCLVKIDESGIVESIDLLVD